jgi:2-polyprenyl-6-methoxyphenol hydroxylase-like FAD-dependent oxidoreductase
LPREAIDTDVIIVGGGPCGLTLAVELGRRGVRVILLDQDPGTSTDPKGNAIQARTMEHFRRLGFADVIRNLGLPGDYPTDIAYFTRYTQHELARFRLPTSRQARQLAKSLSGSWSTPELPHRCTQMLVEQVLRREAEKLPTVSVCFDRRVSALEDLGGHTAVDVVQGDGTKRLTCAYLIGCDGARSLVRKHLGIGYSGQSGKVRDFMGGRMHAIYFRAPRLFEEISAERAWMYWTFNADRRSFMAAVNGRDEFVYHTQLKADETDATITDADARNMFAQSFGRRVDFEILSRASWTAGFALVADRFQAGRIFVAGDAAHLFTPTGGLGYNTAIEDAVNLGWKLAAVTKGWAGSALLDTYELERRPIAVRNTGYAQGFADSIGLFVPAPTLEEDSPAGEAALSEAGAYLEKHAREEFNIPGITFGGRYDGSPAVIGDGTAPPPDRANEYVQTACPGGRAPHAWLDGDISLFDRFGPEFTLLRLTDDADTGPLERAAGDLDVPLTTVDAREHILRDIYEADLALIRPDQVVAWRGNGSPDDPKRVLEIAATGKANAGT